MRQLPLFFLPLLNPARTSLSPRATHVPKFRFSRFLWRKELPAENVSHFSLEIFGFVWYVNNSTAYTSHCIMTFWEIENITEVVEQSHLKLCMCMCVWVSTSTKPANVEFCCNVVNRHYADFPLGDRWHQMSVCLWFLASPKNDCGGGPSQSFLGDVKNLFNFHNSMSRRATFLAWKTTLTPAPWYLWHLCTYACLITPESTFCIAKD